MATCNGPNQDPLLETTSIENRAICRQIAACFARILNPGFFDRCVHQTPHGAGGSGYGAAVTMDLQRKLFFWRVSSLIAYKKRCLDVGGIWANDCVLNPYIIARYYKNRCFLVKQSRWEFSTTDMFPLGFTTPLKPPK